MKYKTVYTYEVTTNDGKYFTDGTMQELAALFQVNPTALFYAAKRGSYFLHRYRVKKIRKEEPNEQ